MSEKKLKITQIRSIIHTPSSQKRTIEALGLGRPNWRVVQRDTPQIRGMIKKVEHLVKVESVEPEKNPDEGLMRTDATREKSATTQREEKNSHDERTR